MSSKVRSANRDSLHRVKWTPNWVFRRYSSEKRREFIKSTGIPATDANAAAAYKIGREAFDEWLGVYLPSGRQLLIKDIARAILVSKETKKGGKRGGTYRSAHNQIKNHIIPAFGHLKPEQITPLKWKVYLDEERRKGKRTKFANTLKFLMEILHRAKDEKAIRDVPKLKNFDAPPAPPVYIPKRDFGKLHRALGWKVRWLSFLMYYQGARPHEVLQYEWSMFNWKDGPTGSISIPGKITKTGRSRKIPLNARVSRAFRWLQERSESPFVFPARDGVEGPLSAYNAVWDRAVDRLEFEYTIYNLRDTFITNALKRGFSSVFVGKYCDTSSQMIDKKYAVAEQEAMRGVAG